MYQDHAPITSHNHFLPATITPPQPNFPQSVLQPHHLPWAFPNFPHILPSFSSLRRHFPQNHIPAYSISFGFQPSWKRNCILPLLHLFILPPLYFNLKQSKPLRPHLLHLLHFPPLYCNLGLPTPLMDVSTLYSLLPLSPSSSLLPYPS